ncbi:hypothetical protein DH2020_011160 [Rehmannia glutinosa]|uniref:Uncharacterized protein n=1 Tax=Rehmannia glutinosa TaxID=99300 RepID=A0ABR0XCN0_REHGL
MDLGSRRNSDRNLEFSINRLEVFLIDWTEYILVVQRALVMERSEPTLVPEWLKNAGSSTGGGSVSHTDDHTASRVVRNKSFVNSNGHDFGRSSSSERTTSANFRRSSSSNSSGNFRSYSSFGRNQRDRDWEKDTYGYHDREKSAVGDRRYRDFSDPLGNTSLSKFERDGLRRSQSMISGKRGDTWPKKVVTDSSDASGKNMNGFLTRGSPVGGVNKAAFERNFPSLGAEERSATPEVGRVPSPGLSSAIQSLPVGTSTLIGGEKWSSALAEVPMLGGNNGTVLSSVQQATPSSSASGALSSTTSLNMAEAVAHGPSRAQATPQLSVGTQRLEELVIKQSRQLIPVTPSMPKTLYSGRPFITEYVHAIIVDYFSGFNISDNFEAWETHEVGLIHFSFINTGYKQKSKVGLQQHSISSSLPVNHSPRGGPVKGDVSKASTVGKLHVLKPVRDKNGVTPVVKDNLSPTNRTKAVSSTLTASPTVSGPAAARGPQNTAVTDRKPVLTVLEKRPTTQAQSRNDFFNLVRKQSMANPSSPADLAIMANSSSALDTGTVSSPAFLDKHAELEAVPATTSEGPLSVSVGRASEEKADLTCNGDQKHVSNGKKHPSSDPIISEEEEAAFLRSLGWEENDEEGGLTDEEISSFYKDLTKYINSKPPLKILQGVQLKFLLPFDSQIGGVGGISSGLSSSDAKLES